MHMTHIYRPRLGHLLLAALAFTAIATTATAAERRCGWIANPTPGNWWLTDKDAEWTISTQGGPEAKGVDLPDFTTHDWVVTNAGDHGYGCACLTGVFDHKSKQVKRITAVSQRTLGQCKADKGLKPPEG
jgi:hypothetical protein